MAVLAACGGKTDDNKVAANTVPVRSEPTPGAPATPSDVAPGASIESAAALTIGTTVSGEIKTKEHSSFYKVDYAAAQRDLVVIKLLNRSTTLRPSLKLYNAAKSEIDSKIDSTLGANLQTSLVMQPGDTVYVRLLPFSSLGAYELSVTAQMAFDAFEPNDDILSAKPATVGTPIEANVMDGKDDDFYRFSGATRKTVRVTFENLSTTLRPSVKYYSSTKSQKGDRTDGTRGANLDYELEIEPGKDFYLQVAPYASSGKYRLSVTNP
jgi:hypothetical protein